MDRAKYVVVELLSGVCMMETPIVFPCYIGHDDIVRQMGIEPDKVLSAGFVEFFSKEHFHCGMPYHVVEVSTFGKSTSLKVESLPTDASLISRALKLE